MCKIKSFVAATFLMLPLAHFGQHTDEINSNRPGETMSAFAVGKSVIQVESGIYGIKESHSVQNYNSNGFGIDLTVRYGFFREKLELMADVQYQFEQMNAPMSSSQNSDFKQTILGAKYLIYDPFKNYKKKVNVLSWKANHAFNWRQFLPAFSVYAGANFVMKENPYYFSPEGGITPKIVLIAQNHLGDGSWVFVTNIIADYIGSDFPSYGYGITLTKGFNQKWSGFLENQGYISDFYSDAILRGGAAYLLSKDMQLDASISSSIKNTPSILYGGIGFSWRYDAKYKEVKLDDNKDKGKDKGKGKDKEKSKKRKDAVETTPKTE